MKALVNTGLNIASKSLNSSSWKENSSASLIRMVGSDACTFTCLRYPKKMSSAEIKENYWPSISSSGPYEAGEQYRYLFVIVVVVFCGDLYHYQRMHTVRLVTIIFFIFMYYSYICICDTWVQIIKIRWNKALCEKYVLLIF